MSDILEELKTPIAYKTQILVVGGGTAGWAAAVCAARHGSNVLLIERNYELGGTSTTGMMHLFGSTMQNMHGLMKEIILNLSAAREVKVGPLSPFDGQAYTQLIFDMINQSGAKLLLGVTFSRTIVEGRCVKGVVIETKSGRQAIMADVVIDATGDGDVCASAGAEFVMGRTNDNKMRPISLLFRIGNVHTDALIQWAEAHPEEFKNDTNSHIIDHVKGLYRLHGFFNVAQKGMEAGELDKHCHYLRLEYVWPGRDTALVNSTRVYDVNALVPNDLTRGIMEARRQIFQIIQFLKMRIPGCEDIYLLDVASMPGIRETRHIMGDYLLQERDLESQKSFPDQLYRDMRRVKPGAEVHSPDGNEGAVGDALEREGERQLYSFSVPYRSFLPKGLDGILMAGRCISATHQADGWTRDQPGCILMGQAVGTAAAAAVAANCQPREIPVSIIQKMLYDDGVMIG